MNAEENIQIFFSSQNATSYNNGLTSDCNFYLPMIELPSQHHIYLSVLQSSIPYTFYQINSTNNAFNFYINGAQNSLTIPQGNYNVNQLITWVTSNTILSATYSIITNKITLSHPSYAFNFLTNATCLSLFGISASNLFSTNNSLTSDKCVNLLAISCVCIHTNLLTGNFTMNDKAENTIIQSIPVNAPPYSMICFNNTGAMRSCLYTNTISYINIRLVDQNNNPIDLNGCHFSITLNIDVVKFVE